MFLSRTEIESNFDRKKIFNVKVISTDEKNIMVKPIEISDRVSKIYKFIINPKNLNYIQMRKLLEKRLLNETIGVSFKRIFNRHIVNCVSLDSVVINDTINKAISLINAKQDTNYKLHKTKIIIDFYTKKVEAYLEFKNRPSLFFISILNKMLNEKIGKVTIFVTGYRYKKRRRK
jgi:hypothetical protein